VKCPSCGQTISDEVNLCPNCGYLIKYSKESKRSMMPSKYIGAILVFLIIGATLGYYYFYADSGDEYVPYDADFYVRIDGEALSYGSDELPSGLIESLGEDIDPEMERLLDNIETLTLFGYEEDPEGLVMIVDPIDNEEMQSFLDDEMNVSSTIDIDGQEFNMVEDNMGYLWLEDKCLLGSKEGIEICIEVNKGDVDSLEGTSSFKNIMDLMPTSQIVMYASIMDSEQVGEYDDILGEMPEFSKIGAIASGINPELGEMVMVMEMANDEDAASASKKINLAMIGLKSMMGEEFSFDYELEEVNNYLKISIVVEDLDLEELMSDGLFDPSSILEGDVF